MQHGWINTAHGRLHYGHEGSGEPIVLIHSNGGSAYQFEAVMPLLAGRFQVLALDLPGHGDSDRIIRHHSIEDYAQVVVAFLDALGLPKASIGGSSLGGSITVAMGAIHGHRVDKLFPIETPPRKEEDWAANWNQTDTGFGLPTQSEERVKQRLNVVTPDVLARWNVDRNKAGSWTMVDAMWAIRQFPVQQLLPRVTPPTRIILGAKGSIIAHRETFERLLPAASIVVIQDAGHFPMIDQPKAFSEAVLSFAG